MINFTEEQKAAIDHPGSLVITACPGSGKTAVMAAKIQLELEKLKSHQGVAAITFTKKASQELEHRCRAQGAQIRSSFFGTIDSFCLREIIFPFGNYFFDNTLDETKPKYEGDLNDEERALVMKFGDLDSCDRNVFIETIKALQKMGTIFFPTIPQIALIIHETYSACKNYINARYKTIYIDEYQDSSKSQHHLFLSLVRNGCTGVAVGDLRQSIYGWRNCSPEYLKQLTTEPGFSHRTVSINHRCHPSISNYSNRLFNQHFELVESEKTQVWHCKFIGTQHDAAVSLNRLIPAILDKNPNYRLSDVAILARGNPTLDFIREHLTIRCRVYTDNAIDDLNSQLGEFWSALLNYVSDSTLQTDYVLEKIINTEKLPRLKLIALRRSIRRLRTTPQQGLMDEILKITGSIQEKHCKPHELAALVKITSDPEALKQYLPPNLDEVQCMTIHKSKGLEFEVVIHLDLTEWIFPYRKFVSGSKEKIYPDWDQDLNLHFVAVTRAKSICILAHTSERLNKEKLRKVGEPSPFLSLPGLAGLYGNFEYK